MSVSEINLTFVCGRLQEEQTSCSVAIRITLMAIGVIAGLVGVLVLCKIPGLSALGTTNGWLFFSIGLMIYFTGLCFKCTKPSLESAEEYSTSELGGGQSLDEEMQTPQDVTVQVKDEKADLRREIAALLAADLKFCKTKLDALEPVKKLAIVLWIMNYSNDKYKVVHNGHTMYGSDGYDGFLGVVKFCLNSQQKPAIRFFGEEIADLIKGSYPFDITVSEEEMLQAFIEYDGLILLRPLHSKQLLLGCGLHSCRQDQKGRAAVHQEMDTVDIKLEMNPSICCNWSNPNHAAFFANRYETILDEGPCVTYMKGAKKVEVFYQNCASAFDPSASSRLLVLSTNVDPTLWPKHSFSSINNDPVDESFALRCKDLEKTYLYSPVYFSKR